MVSERNRVIDCTKYLEELGIQVNIGKNKARGNKGYFKVQNKSLFSINIAKGLDEESILRVLTHEFAHFIHYQHDSSLQTLDFIFPNLDNALIEEMINLTIDCIPKKSVAPLFEKKVELKKEIDDLKRAITKTYPSFKLSVKHKELENIIKKSEAKYLLKYDKVKIWHGLFLKTYSIENIDKEFSLLPNTAIAYIKIRSNQRYLKRINNKIHRINKYYNTLTELFARTLEMYVFEKEKTNKLAPNITNLLDDTINSEKIIQLNNFIKMLNFT